jgi:hypothetical protein
MDRLDTDYTNIKQKIKHWAITGKLVGSAKKCFKAYDLLHINSSGFENNNTNINTILLPKNVKTNSIHFIDFLEAFGIKIIDKFSFDAEILNEIYYLKLQLLNLIGPVCLLLKNKMIVNDMDKSMYDRFINISKTQFIFCKNIHPIFTNENEVIRGEFVNYFYDKNDNKFRLSIDWKNPLTILEISYEISLLMLAVRLEKEIMMLLSMSLSQIEQYLKSQKLDLKEYQNSEIYQVIIEEIKKIEQLIRGKLSEAIIDDSNTILKDDYIKKDEEERNQVELEVTKEVQVNNPFKDITPSDEKFIRSIIKGEFELNEKLDAHTTAKIKTLLVIKVLYDISEITDEGRFLKAGKDEILVRSAQGGILYLDVYNWGRLSEENVSLSVYTNDKIEIYSSQKQLFDFTKPQNKFGIVRMPTNYTMEDYNSLDKIVNKGKWHYIFIVNENTKAAQGYKEVMNLEDYNF